MSYSFRAIQGSEQFELPDWQGTTLGFDFSDVGTFSGQYTKIGKNSSLLADKAIIIALWNGAEGPNSRFMIRGGENDDDAESSTFKIAGFSIMDLFRRVVVEEIAGKPGESIRFDAAKAGAILINLLTAAQARGAATGITWTFTGTHDSNGVPWSKVISIEYRLGLSYLDLIRNLIDQMMMEIRFNGFVLEAYNSDTMGRDLAIGDTPLELKAGVDYEETPRKWSSEEQAKFSMTVGDEGIVVRRVDAVVPDGPFGREEMALSQGGTKNLATLNLINDAALGRVKQTRQQLTRKAIIREDGPIPNVDYQVSDYILERVSAFNGTEEVAKTERYRVRSIVVETDASGKVGSASLVLNDKFLEAQIRIARRVNGIIGGGTADGGGNGTPVDDKPDTTTPKPPTGVIADLLTYEDATGRTLGVASVDWNDPVLNTDDSVLADLAGFEVEIQTDGQVTYSVPQSVDNARLDQSLRNRFDRRSKPSPGWLGGDNASNIRTDDGKDWFFWADTIYGRSDATGRVIGSWRMPHSSLTISDPALGTDLNAYFASPNSLPDSLATCSTATGWSVTNGTLATNSWSRNGYTSLELTRTAVGSMSAYAEVAAVAGSTWRAEAQFDPTGTATENLRVQFLNASNGNLGLWDSSVPASGRGSVLSGVAPANTAKVRITISDLSAGAIGDKIRFTQTGLSATNHQLATWRRSTSTTPLKNLFVNPGFVTTSGTVEVKRNYCPNPVPTSVTGWTGIGTSMVDAPWDPTRKAFKATSNGTNGHYLFSPTSATLFASGTKVTVSATIQVPAGKWYRYALHNRTPNSYRLYSSYVQSDGNPVRVKISQVLTADAPLVDFALLAYENNTGGLVAAGTDIYAADVVISPGSHSSPFNGSSAPAEGLTYSWAGPVNNSETIATGARIVNGMLGQSSLPAWRVPGASPSGRSAITAYPSGSPSAVVLIGASTTAASPGKFYATRFKARVVGGIGGEQAQFYTSAYNGGAAVNQVTTSENLTLTAEWKDVLLRSDVAAGAGTTNVRPLISRVGTTWDDSTGRIEIAEVVIPEVVGFDQLPPPFFDGAFGTGFAWDSTVNNSPSTWTVNNADHQTSSPASLFVSDDAGGPLEEYVWSSDAFHTSGKAYLFLSGQRFTPGGTLGGYGFTNSGNIYMVEIEVATKKVLRMERWSNDEISWGNATRIEGAYVYIMGYKRVATFQENNYLSRVPVANPWGTREYWNGAAWVTDASAASNVVQTPFGISAFRKMPDNTWCALYTPYYADKLYMATAATLTGPWTTGNDIFKYPEPSGNTGIKTFKYLTRFVPQWDTNSEGIALLYCQNGDAIGNVLNYVPQFLRGPAGVVTAGSPGTQWRSRQDVTDAPAIFSGLIPGSVFSTRVRAYDESKKHYSTWAATLPAMVPSDVTGPPKPATPLAESLFQGGRVTHNGLSANGSPMPPDTWGYQVHVSSAGEDFEPTWWTLQEFVPMIGGVSVVQGLKWNTDYWVKLVYIDHSLNKSEPSDAAMFGTIQLSDPDLPDKLITGAKIAENTIYAKNLTVAAFSDNLIAGGGNMEESGESGRPYGWTLGYWQGEGVLASTLISHTINPSEVISGTGAMKMRTTTTAAQSARTFATMVSGGDTYYYAFKVKTSASLASGVITHRLWTSEVEKDIIDFTKPHTTQQLGLNQATAADVVTTIEGSFTIPAGHKFGSLDIRGDMNGSDYFTIIDDVEFKKIIGEAAIANASIGNAKIKDLAVDNAKIANLSVGKLTTGIMTADVTVAGVFKTGDVGARARMDNTGFKQYDSAGSLRFSTENGNVFVSGTIDGSSIRGGAADFPHPWTTDVPGRVHMDDDGFYTTSDSTTNMCTNPSFKSLTGVTPSSNTTAVIGGAAVSDFAGNTDVRAMYGDTALKVSNTTSNGYVDIAIGNAQPNTQYTVSWHASSTRIDNGSPGLDAVYGDWANCGVIRVSNGSVIASGRDGYVFVQGAFAGKWPSVKTTGLDWIAYPSWQTRLWKTFTTPSDLPVNSALRLRLPAPRTSGGGNETTLAVAYDAVQMEQKAYMTRYCDGDQPGAEWSGTKHASSSTRGLTSFGLWLPSYGDPLFTGNVRAPVVTTQKLKVGSGSFQGSNYVEKFAFNPWTMPQNQWWGIGFPDNGGMIEERIAQDDGPILSGSVFVAQSTGFYMFTTSVCWESNGTGVRLLRHYLQTTTGAGTKYVVAQDPRSAASMGPNHVHTLTTTTFMAKGWSIGLEGWQSAGVNININAHANAAPCKAAFSQIA